MTLIAPVPVIRVHLPRTEVAYAVITKSAESRYTLGPVYIPGMVDAHGDYATATELQKAIWEYVDSGDRTIFLQHSPLPAGRWVEIMSWPHPHSMDLQVQGSGPTRFAKSVFPAGTAYMGVIWEPWSWALVKAGEINGFSMGGMAVRTHTDVISKAGGWQPPRDPAAEWADGKPGYSSFTIAKPFHLGHAQALEGHHVIVNHGPNRSAEKTTAGIVGGYSHTHLHVSPSTHSPIGTHRVPYNEIASVQSNGEAP